MNGPAYASSIGGFFELELPAGPGRPHPRAHAALASGRACLRAIVDELQPVKVWLPFYICDSVLNALTQAHVSYAFYELTEKLEAVSLPELDDREYLLYVNYFGLKTAYADMLVRHYGPRLLLDLTQAFFEEPKNGQWAFNSARKFFGVPDGAYLYGPTRLSLSEIPSNQAISLEHLLRRQLGQQTTAYTAYSQYEEQLSYGVRSMSDVSRSWMSWLNYSAIAQTRKANFRLYHDILLPLLNKSGGGHEWLPLASNAVPFCYPLRLTQPLTNRQQLFEQRIFVPWLWPEILHRSPDFPREKSFVSGVLALPVDHRYGPAEIEHVANTVAAILVQAN